ncbi:MAG: 50S ribosomal protein L4, partial [Bacteroidota bacterium]
KGTGTARAGSIKSPVFRGGGRIFGPRPKDYNQKLNKNVKRLARKSALSQKTKAKSLVVVEDFNFEAPKTKDFVSFLTSLGIENNKSLVVLGGANDNVYLSSRNLERSEVINSSELNTYKIVNANSIVLTESALEGIESNLKK